MKIFQPIVSGSFTTSGSVFLKGLTSAAQSNVVLIDTASGQLYTTASSALGGGIVATASFATTASNVLGGTTNYIPLWNTATSLSSSVIYQSASHIGIGTTTPAYKLYVTDTVNTNGIIAGLFGGASYGAALSYSRGGNYSWTTGIGNAGGAPTSFFTISEQGTTPRLVIAHTTGNVGIGTTAPSSKLDVIGGDIGISLNSWFGSYYNGQTTLRPILGFNNGNTILRSVAGTTGINFQNSSGITKMFLSETSGNVGIETTAPSASLHVQGTVMISSSIFQYSNNAAILSGSTANIASFPTSSYMAGFFDFVASSGLNARAGTVFTVWNGTSLEYVETSTNDIGSTTNLILSASLSGANVLLQGTSLSGSWSVKTLTRMI